MSLSLSTSSKKVKVELNPLLIDVIARNIFQYLSLNDILECRLVCKTWNVEGTSRLVSRINDVAIDPPISERYGTSIVNYFLDMMKNCKFNFTKFRFVKFPIGCSEINQLVAVCGSTIKSLHLHQVSVTSMQLSDLLMKLPCLEILEISNLPKDVITNAIFPDDNKKPELSLKQIILHLEYGEAKYGRSFLRDLFKYSNELMSLSLISNYDSERTERDIIDALIAEQSTNIEKFKLSSVDDRVLELLQHFKSSSLTKFAMGYKPMRYLQENGLQTILHDHKDTWEHLEFGIQSNENILKFPQMPNLKFLSIGSNFPMSFNSGHLRFDAFDYGKQFPNLVTLKLYDTGSQFGKTRHFNLDELFPETSTAALSVKNLELPPELSCEVLRRIGNIFPNVLKLNLRYQQYEVFSELWITWPLLKTLAIAIFKNDHEESMTSMDSIFTGFSEDSLEKWKKSKEELDIEPFRIKPSICLLKHLKHLLIYDGRRLGQWENGSPQPKITNATAVLSLSKMKELVCLNIPKIISQITQDCVHDLCGQLELLETLSPISTYLVKYEWQKKVSSINSYLYESFPEYK